MPTDPVQMATLGFLLEAAGAARIDLIKIDTERFEIDVSAGAKKTLGQYQPVILLEMNSWCLIAFRNMNPRVFFWNPCSTIFPSSSGVTPCGELRRIGKGVRRPKIATSR